MGVYLNERTSKKLWGKYLKKKGITSPPIPRDVLLISPHKKEEIGGWLQTAVHEYAHLIRNEFKEPYPFRRGMDWEQFNLGFENAVFPDEKWNTEPLFGDYALTWCQSDGVHDPIFYLIFYVLDRKAEDSGFYKIKSKPVISRTF